MLSQNPELDRLDIVLNMNTFDACLQMFPGSKFFSMIRPWLSWRAADGRRHGPPFSHHNNPNQPTERKERWQMQSG
jgi:hypothetical protein